MKRRNSSLRAFCVGNEISLESETLSRSRSTMQGPRGRRPIAVQRRLRHTRAHHAPTSTVLDYVCGAGEEVRTCADFLDLLSLRMISAPTTQIAPPSTE